MKNSIDQEYEGIVHSIRQFNISQMTKLPNGWYNVVSASGADLGMGFHCAKCKIHIPGRAPTSVKHCGKTDKRSDANSGNRRSLKHFLRLQRIKPTVILKNS